MDVLVRALTGGNVVLKLVALQLAVAALIVFLLKKTFERELFLSVLEKIAHIPAENAADVREVVIVTAGGLSADDALRLRALIRQRFSLAEITEGQDRSLWGGLVVRVGCVMIDGCLSTKIRQIFRASDA